LIRIQELTDSQARHAMRSGEFGSDVTGRARRVAVVLTQGWCPQWKTMRRWLGDLAERDPNTDPDVWVFELEYDGKDYFDEFLRTKEELWRNRLVPYLRYYADGRLVGETNSVSEPRFFSMFGLNRRRAGT